MGAIEPWHLVLLLAVILIVVGPGKLPQVGKGIGEAMREFRKATGELQETTRLTAAAQSGVPASQPAPAQPGAQAAAPPPAPNTLSGEVQPNTLQDPPGGAAPGT